MDLLKVKMHLFNLKPDTRFIKKLFTSPHREIESSVKNMSKYKSYNDLMFEI